MLFCFRFSFYVRIILTKIGKMGEKKNDRLKKVTFPDLVRNAVLDVFCTDRLCLNDLLFFLAV